MLQKRTVRLIENAKTVSHCDPLFLKYRLLKLNDMSDFNQATFMYKTRITCYPLHLPTHLKNSEILKDLSTFKLTF